MPIVSKNVLLICISMVALMNCNSNKFILQHKKAIVDYNEIIRVGLDNAQHPSSKWRTAYDCINVDRRLALESKAIPIYLSKKGYDVSNGYFAADSLIKLNFISTPNSNLPIQWTSISKFDSLSTACSNFMLQLKNPYHINDSTIYISYYFFCGVLCGEGYYGIFDISDPNNYELLKFEMTFIE